MVPWDEPLEEHAVKTIAHPGCAIVTQAEVVGLNHRVIRVTDPDAIAAVAADDVGVNKWHQRGRSRPGQDVAVRLVEDPHAVLAIAQSRVARDVRADEVGRQRVGGCPSR